MAVWLLALSVTLGYASLIFAFGALLVPTQAATGWSKPAMAGGPTLALVVAALVSPLAGRQVDRGRGPETMTAAALLGGLALLMVSRAQTLWHWYLAWAAAGPAIAGMLYETCFAFLTRRLGAAATPAIIRVTLVAGLASTLAFAFGAHASRTLGWRGAWVAFALMDLVIAAPGTWVAGRLLRRGMRPGDGRVPARPGVVRQAMRRPGFWVLGAVFSLSWLNHTMLVTLFIPLFTGLGASEGFAVAAASVMGPFQVLGRLGLMLAGARFRVLPTTLAIVGVMAGAGLTLLAAGLEVRLILAFAVLQGTGIGIMSILRPVLTAEVMGREDFGAISGALAIGPLFATAAAPALGALLFAAGGPAALSGGAVALTLVAALLVVLLARTRRGQRPA